MPEDTAPAFATSFVGPFRQPRKITTAVTVHSSRGQTASQTMNSSITIAPSTSARLGLGIATATASAPPMAASAKAPVTAVSWIRRLVTAG